MKRKTAIASALGLFVGLTITSTGIAQAPKMKMTTEIPPGIATPDKLETRLGTLKLFDGVPDKDTAQKVYDNLDFQRAVQAYLNSIQIASMGGMRKGILEFGPPNTTALLFENSDGFQGALSDAEHNVRLHAGLARNEGRALCDRNTAERPRHH